MTYVEPFLGAGATWLRLLDPTLTPPCAWMGDKRELAPEILSLLDLRPGKPPPCLLGDASWWGWVWPTCLDPVTGPEVSAVFRFWRETRTDPRALWFWLRDVGPMSSAVEAAAQLLWLQARAASGVPVWWEGEAAQGPGYNWGQRVRDAKRREGAERQEVLLAAPGDGRPRQLAADRGGNGLVQRAHDRGPYTASMSGDRALVQWASTKVDGAGQRQACAKGFIGGRLIATTHGDGQPPSSPYDAGQKGPTLLASDGRGDPRESGQRTTRQDRLLQHGGGTGESYDAGSKGRGGAGGIIDPGTIAHRLDRIRQRIGAASSVVIEHRSALALTEEHAPRLRQSTLHKGAAVYLDPPYQGATGYPVTCPRDEVLQIAELWARHGARVVVSEAVGLAGELGRGWDQVCLRPGPKAEWVTCYGSDVSVVVPPLLRLGRAA